MKISQCPPSWRSRVYRLRRGWLGPVKRDRYYVSRSISYDVIIELSTGNTRLKSVVAQALACASKQTYNPRMRKIDTSPPRRDDTQQVLNPYQQRHKPESEDSISAGGNGSASRQSSEVWLPDKEKAGSSATQDRFQSPEHL